MPQFHQYCRLLRCNILCLTACTLLLAWAGSISAAEKEILLPHGSGSANHNLVRKLELARHKTLADGVVLMLHGTMAHNEMGIMRQFSRQFNDQGFNTLSVNFSLGLDKRRGMFDCALPSDHRAEDALVEIGAWLDWLKQQGVGKVILFGFSRGGHQAAWFAAGKPHPLVQSIVLLAPAIARDLAVPERYRTRFNTPIEPVLAKANDLVKAGKGSSRLDKVGFLNCDQTSVSAAAFRSYYALDTKNDTPELLKRITSPTLVVIAGGDEIVRDAEKRLSPSIDGKRLQKALVPGADHFFHNLYGEDAMDAILAYLRAQ
jgi:pimeloyl-ACP methyl ester carboxylesterase